MFVNVHIGHPDIQMALFCRHLSKEWELTAINSAYHPCSYNRIRYSPGALEKKGKKCYKAEFFKKLHEYHLK